MIQMEAPQIPPQCKDCLWIKDSKCFYEGDKYDDFNDDIEEGGLNTCHSKVEGVESVDWSDFFYEKKKGFGWGCICELIVVIIAFLIFLITGIILPI